MKEINFKNNITMELLQEEDGERITLRKDGYIIGFRCVLDITDNGVVSFRLTEGNMPIELTDDELFSLAKENTQRLFPLRKMSLGGALGFGSDDTSNYVLTNESAFAGAVTVFYDGVLDSILDEWGCGFFILPSSRHEVILLPDNGEVTAYELNELVRNVNQIALEPEDVLGDTVMYYDKEGIRVA